MRSVTRAAAHSLPQDYRRTLDGMIHDTSCQMACDGCHGDVAVAPAFAQLLVNSEYIRAVLLKNRLLICSRLLLPTNSMKPGKTKTSP